MVLTPPLDPEDFPMESPAPSKVAALESEVCDSPMDTLEKVSDPIMEVDHAVEETGTIEQPMDLYPTVHPEVVELLAVVTTTGPPVTTPFKSSLMEPVPIPTYCQIVTGYRLWKRTSPKEPPGSQPIPEPTLSTVTYHAVIVTNGINGTNRAQQRFSH